MSEEDLLLKPLLEAFEKSTNPVSINNVVALATFPSSW